MSPCSEMAMKNVIADIESELKGHLTSSTSAKRVCTLGFTFLFSFSNRNPPSNSPITQLTYFSSQLSLSPSIKVCYYMVLFSTTTSPFPKGTNTSPRQTLSILLLSARRLCNTRVYDGEVHSIYKCCYSQAGRNFK